MDGLRACLRRALITRAGSDARLAALKDHLQSPPDCELVNPELVMARAYLWRACVEKKEKVGETTVDKLLWLTFVLACGNGQTIMRQLEILATDHEQEVASGKHDHANCYYIPQLGNFIDLQRTTMLARALYNHIETAQKEEMKNKQKEGGAANP